MLMGLVFYRDVQFSLRDLLLFSIKFSTGFFITIGLRPFYRKIYDRFHSLLKILAIIVLASIVITIIWQLLDSVLSRPFLSDQEIEKLSNGYRPFRLMIVLRKNLSWFSYIIIWSVLYFGIRNWFAQTEEKIRAERAIALANQATLQMLRYQINPHFLFNTLNSIQALMYQNVGKADLMLTELSEFLRFSLKYKTDLYIDLKDEFELLEKYLFIQKIRFDDNLTYHIDLPEELSCWKILCFLVQPLVENAVKHGIKSDPFTRIEIWVSATREHSRLVILISNTGKWIENPANDGTGIANVRERLENAYPGNYSLSFSEENGIVHVKMNLPVPE